MQNEKERYLLNLISRIDGRIGYLESKSRHYSNFRLFLFISGLIIFSIYYFFLTNYFLLSLLVIVIIVFLITANFHNKIDLAVKRTLIWREIKKTQLSKIRLNWKNIPSVESSNSNIDPLEADLNLAGEQSLHQLINIAVTKQGKEILRKYLSISEPGYNDILSRQNLVKELVPMSRFRDKIKLISLYPSKKELNGASLVDWLEKSNSEGHSKKYFVSLALLAPINLALFILYLYLGIYPYWIFTLLVYVSLYYFGNKLKNKTLDEFEFLQEQLNQFGLIFEFIEKYPLPKNSNISKLCEPFTVEGINPSVLLKKISNAYVAMTVKKGNPFVWGMLCVIFPADFYYNGRLYYYKGLIKRDFKIWLETLYKLEAINSLANFAWLNPGYVFPEIVNSKKTKYKAVEVGHPLLQEEKRINNNFTFGERGEINLITGSNMSGKSTFLRTLGINLCLAYAGAPVCAEKFECSLFRIFTCIKVYDSVVDGISYFYAEVKRLKALLDEAGREDNRPLFFLIDEIFRGTNNIERLKGSAAYIKAISGMNSVGALATHDLELVKLESQIKSLKNYHFKEHIIGDQMKFDYKIQHGPCPTTNALKIMEIEGLPTEE